MEGSKVKNLIIVILLLVNLFLLAMVLHDRVEETKTQKQSLKDVAAAYEDSGIKLSAELHWDEKRGGCSLHRDLSREGKLAKAVIGTCTVDDLGGNILYYKGANGEARFRGTGEFEIVLATHAIPVSGSPLDTAKSVLDDMGYKTDLSLAVTENMTDSTKITLLCMHRNSSVYNCSVSFLFTPEYLMMIEGRRLLEWSADGESSAFSAPTVLMRFLTEVREHGTVCSEVLELELGYSMAASASGEGTLTPYWRIVTDAGQYYVNAMTGKIESYV